MAIPFIEIQQTWWHIEDQKKPSRGRVFRQVMDIYTDSPHFEVPLKHTNFIGLKIIGRNINRELAYVENGENIIINLGNLNDWPTIESSWSIRHVKIEIEYTIMDFKLTEKKVPFTGYQSVFGIKEEIQPEFYITLPKGMVMETNNTTINLLLKKGEKEFILEFKPDKIYVNKNKDKDRYNITTSSSDFEEIKKYSKEYDVKCLGVDYKVRNERIMVLMPLFAILVLFTSSVIELVLKDILTIPYLVLIAYIALYLSLRKEEYEIHYDKFVFWVIIASGILLFIKILMYTIFQFSINSTIMNTT